MPKTLLIETRKSALNIISSLIDAAPDLELPELMDALEDQNTLAHLDLLEDGGNLPAIDLALDILQGPDGARVVELIKAGEKIN